MSEVIIIDDFGKCFVIEHIDKPVKLSSLVFLRKEKLYFSLITIFFL